MKPKSLGQIAYEAYNGPVPQAVIDDTFKRYPEFKNKWNKIASAVAREVRRRDKVRRKR